MTSKSSAGKPEVKTGGMKASASAPSSLPSAKMSHKSSLFDNDDDDDLFAPTTESRCVHVRSLSSYFTEVHLFFLPNLSFCRSSYSQKKSQRVALLFEDEGDVEDKGSLFGVKPAVNTNTAAPAAKVSALTYFLCFTLVMKNNLVLKIASSGL